MEGKNKRVAIKYGILIKTFIIIYMLSFFFNFREFSFDSNESYGKVAIALSFISFILAMLISELQICTHDYRTELIEVSLIFWAVTTVIFLICWIGTGNITVVLVFILCPLWGMFHVLKGQIANVVFLLVCVSETIRFIMILRSLKKHEK